MPPITPAGMPAQPELFTDLYELRMARAYRALGMGEAAVFSLFVRRLPPRRNYLLACGIEDLLDTVAALRFGPESLDYLRGLGEFPEDFLRWLAGFRFSGEIHAMAEGTPVFAEEPVLEVIAPIAEAQMLETLAMNQVGLQTLLASKAARVAAAAAGRPVVDFGSRRAQGIDAAVAGARAFHLAGVAATSNLLAGARYGIPVAGTMAHSFVQAFDDEAEAFRAFAQLQPATEPETAGTTLAEQAFRIVAGNVVYDDLFKGRSEQVMKQEEISGVAVPASTFLESPELLSQNSLAELVKRTQGGGGGTDGGLHGNQIEGVLVQPDGQALSPDQETTIIASDQLAFEVQVKNSGDFQETKVKVTLTITSPEPIKRQATIDLINAGETKSVTFRDFSNIDFSRPYTLKVAVKPVEGEQNTDNNTAEYPVIFSLE